MKGIDVSEEQLGHVANSNMTSNERRDSHILIVEDDLGTRNSLRQALTSLGFANISEAADHNIALKKLEEGNYSHMIFDASWSGGPIRDFLLSVLELDSSIIAIPTSFQPTVDEVFDLLMVGARSFLVKPFNTVSVDEAIVGATKGEQLSDAILYARDRNEALAALIMTNLDRLAMVMKQARKFETARREIPKRQAVLRRSVDIGKTFAQGGEHQLVNSIMAFCLERSQGPATRVGRLKSRKKLSAQEPGKKRKKGPKANSLEPKADIPEPSTDSSTS